ncbi:hypothetical protein PC116_g28421 [Phytophthora cactorum]|nr:hypothetical protein PC116_g28421 [Phytophthora cactorum]
MRLENGRHAKTTTPISDIARQEEARQERIRYLGYEGVEDLQNGFRRARLITAEYLTLLNKTPIYWAAIILYPGKGLRGIKLENPELAREVKDRVKEYWIKHYIDPPKPQSPGEATATKKAPAPAPATATATRPPDPKKRPWAPLFDSPDLDDEDEDEFEQYLQMEKAGFKHGFKRGQDPILWWKEHEQKFPRLHQFALDVLSIPATSIECKRILRQSEPELSGVRPMPINVLEAIQCLKQWSKDDEKEGVEEGGSAEPSS